MTGNVINPCWLNHIRTKPSQKNGKTRPNMNAIYILSDLIYWSSDTIIRDEETGQVTEVKKKYKMDKLQKSYRSYSDLMGITKDTVKEAFSLLKEMGLISVEFRTVKMERVTLSNVMFIEVIDKKVQEISCSIRDDVGKKTAEGSGVKKTPPQGVKKTPHIHRLHIQENTNTYKQHAFSSENAIHTAQEETQHTESLVKRKPGVRDVSTERNEVYRVYNDLFKKTLKPSPTNDKNLRIHLDTYTVTDLVEALSIAATHPWYKDKLTPTIFLRTRDTNHVEILLANKDSWRSSYLDMFTNKAS